MVNFKKIYLKYLEEFKKQVKDTYVEDLFNKNESERIELERIHTKNNQDPETITSDIIREMLRECNIDPLSISREIMIEGRGDSFEKVKKKPDFYIESKDPDRNSLFFEIEHLNKNLTHEGDGEGIEQAREWYSVKPTLFFHYDSIVTNFLDWYFIKCDNEVEDFIIDKKEPWEMLEIIADIRFGRAREYLIENMEETKNEITTKFYSEFQERLKKLLGKPSSVDVDIYIENYNKPTEISNEEYEQKLIAYYRTIFSRLLFIKILESWKMLKIDPLSYIFKEDKRFWSFELKNLFFEVFNKNKNNRKDNILEIFKELPYLNGGLFRPSGIELDENGNLRDIHLNSDAIKDIWDFFKGYKFLREQTEDSQIESNTINPEILGYIFERTIGDERKKTGSYYTPEEITEYMIENTLFSYVIDNVNQYLEKEKIKEIRKISDIGFLENSVDVYHYILTNVLKEITICDPACGSGAFLEKSSKKLLYLYKKCIKGCGRVLPYKSEDNQTDSQIPFPDLYSIKKHIIQNNIYGVDINPSAIEICELRLWLWVLKPPTELITPKEYFDVPPLPNIEYNLRCGNSLIGYKKVLSRKTKRIDESYFAEILDEKESKVNSYYERDQLLDEEEKAEIRQNINNLVEKLNTRLDGLLLKDFKKSDIEIPLDPIVISDYQDKPNYINFLQEKIRKLNNNYTLTKFKVNFSTPSQIKSKKVKQVQGLTGYKDRKSNKYKSLYPTSTFNFAYYSEYGDHPFSKFLIDLIPNWKNVYSIEFHRKVDEKDIEKINPFHWNMEFSEVLNKNGNGGFDIIIGNPPFIRIETIDKVNKEIYKEIYELSEFRFDIFILFYEMSNKIIHNGAYICLVSSNKFLKSKTGKALRKFIRKNFSMKEIFDFKDYNAFQGVGVNVLLMFLKKAKLNETFPYISIGDNFVLNYPSMHSIEKNKDVEISNSSFNIYQIEEENLGLTHWDFYPLKVQKIFKKFQTDNIIDLEQIISTNRQGVVTSQNDVFIVDESTLKEYNIESQFYFKLIKGEYIRRWKEIEWRGEYLIYPYNYNPEEKKKTVIKESENFNVMTYLKDNKKDLLDRYCVTSGNRNWYELHDPVSPKYFLHKKIMLPDVSEVPNFSIDSEGNYFGLDTTYSIIPKKEDHIYYLLAVLNSNLIEFYVNYKFQTLGSAFRFKTFLVNKIPIIDPNEVKEDLFSKITKKAKKIVDIYDKSLINELNSLIYELYLISSDEIEYIEQKIQSN